jgi:iron complex outermembrane receptor protein
MQGITIALLGLPAVQAQETKGELEELIVTAPKYVSSGSLSAMKSDTPLVEIPQSVTVISRDQIDLLNWTSVQQAVRYTAGITGENFGPDERYDWLTLRGFNPVQFIDGLQAPIGATTANLGTDLYAYEAVDILKGPSSALYGLSPPGGIVNGRSRRPLDELGGELGLVYGDNDTKEIHGDITGGLTDNIDGRLTALYRDKGSQVDHVSIERQFVAPAVTFKFGDDTRLTLLSYYQKDEVDGETNGFLPAYGVSLHNPLGDVPASRNLGEPDYNRYVREQWAAGYDFVHNFSDSFSLQQNFKYISSKSKMLVVMAGDWGVMTFDGTTDDYRTVQRFNFLSRERLVRRSRHPSRSQVRHRALGTRWRLSASTTACVVVGPDAPRHRPVSPGSAAPITVASLFPHSSTRCRSKLVKTAGPGEMGQPGRDAVGPRGPVHSDNWDDYRRRQIHVPRRRELRVR